MNLNSDSSAAIDRVMGQRVNYKDLLHRGINNLLTLQWPFFLSNPRQLQYPRTYSTT